jgi:hypothetical protein
MASSRLSSRQVSNSARRFFRQRVTGFVVLEEVRGIDDGNHGIEARETLEAFAVIVGEGECLRDGEGFGDACGLDEEAVEAVCRGEAGDFLVELVAEGAADAAVGHFDEFLLGAAQFGAAAAGGPVFFSEIIQAPFPSRKDLGEAPWADLKAREKW